MFNYFQLIYELSLLKNVNLVTVQDDIEEMIANLVKFFELPFTTEEDKAKVIDQLYLHLTARTYQKVNENLIKVTEVT